MSFTSFKTTILAGESNNVTGIVVPSEALAALGAGQRPRLKVTVNGYSYVSSVGKMGDKFMIGLSAEHRQASGLNGGDAVEVTLELAPEPVTLVPDDLRAALELAGVAERFAKAAPSRRKEWVRSVEEAKAAETRARRIQKVVDALKD